MVNRHGGNRELPDLGKRGPFPNRSQRQAFLRSNPAAQRHWQSPYRACPELHPAGCPGPLALHARLRHPVASLAPTMQKVLPRWWWSGNSQKKASAPARRWADQHLRKKSGDGSRTPETASPNSYVGLEPPATGPGKGSPWMRECPGQ